MDHFPENSPENSPGDLGNREDLNIAQVLQVAFIKYREAFAYYLTFGLIYGLSFLLVNHLLKALQISSPAVNLLIYTLLGSWISMALMYACWKRYKGEEVTFQEAFMRVRRRYWQFVAVFAASATVIGMGFIFLLSRDCIS